jgi:hypothetical protein
VLLPQLIWWKTSPAAGSLADLQITSREDDGFWIKDGGLPWCGLMDRAESGLTTLPFCRHLLGSITDGRNPVGLLHQFDVPTLPLLSWPRRHRQQLLPVPPVEGLG